MLNNTNRSIFMPSNGYYHPNKMIAYIVGRIITNYTSEKVLTHEPPTHPPSSSSAPHPPLLGHRVSIGLSTSSPTMVNQGSSLLHMCPGPQTSLCMILGFWLVSGSSKGSELVDAIVLPLELQPPSAPSVPPLTLPYCSRTSIQLLVVSIYICLS